MTKRAVNNIVEVTEEKVVHENKLRKIKIFRLNGG